MKKNDTENQSVYSATGFVQAMNGDEIWVNTTADEMITIKIKGDKLRWLLYCKNVKVTVEILDETPPSL